jgi:hypothetical protein
MQIDHPILPTAPKPKLVKLDSVTNDSPYISNEMQDLLNELRILDQPLQMRTLIPQPPQAPLPAGKLSKSPRKIAIRGKKSPNTSNMTKMV